MAKEVLILAGREAGASVTVLGEIVGLDPSNVSRRCDAARAGSATDTKLAYALRSVRERYAARTAKSQA